MQTVILCGGLGTRAYPTTRTVPKALMPVDGRTILEHVMQIYALHGFTRFVLCLGYLGDAIVAHFDTPEFAHLQIDFVETGEQTDTGGRIQKCEHLLDERFFVTYCDGLGDVNLHELLRFHTRHVERGGLATVTSVPLQSQYGVLSLNGNAQIVGFQEKPVLPYWINGGFFVFEKRAFDYWAGNNLEQDVLPKLASNGLLYAYQHAGFWKSMDTHKDQLQMNELWPPVLARMVATHEGVEAVASTRLAA